MRLIFKTLYINKKSNEHPYFKKIFYRQDVPFRVGDTVTGKCLPMLFTLPEEKHKDKYEIIDITQYSQVKIKYTHFLLYLNNGKTYDIAYFLNDLNYVKL